MAAKATETSKIVLVMLNDALNTRQKCGLVNCNVSCESSPFPPSPIGNYDKTFNDAAAVIHQPLSYHAWEES